MTAASGMHDDQVIVFAAGSLRAAISELAQAFTETKAGHMGVTLGPSGLLRQRIARGEPADLFIAADLRHPQALVDAGFASRVVVLAGNGLCLLARPGIIRTGDDPLALLLDPQVRLGTSTPGADPCGDYAWELFRKAESCRPGSFTSLAGKVKTPEWRTRQSGTARRPGPLRVAADGRSRRRAPDLSDQRAPRPKGYTEPGGGGATGCPRGGRGLRHGAAAPGKGGGAGVRGLPPIQRKPAVPPRAWVHACR